MLATMRATYAYTHTAAVHSRPDSCTSSHGSSPAATPSRTKADKARGRSTNNVGSSASAVVSSGRKSSTQKKPAHPKHQQQSAHVSEGSDDFAKIPSEDVSAPSVQTSGLLSLSKPVSQLQDDVAGFSPIKGKKAAKKTSEAEQQRNRQQRSASPLVDGAAPAAAAVATTKNAAAGTKNASRNSRRNNRNGVDKNDASIDLLSKSAPSGTLAHAKAVQKATQGFEAAAGTGEPSSGLTWQQELLRSSSGTPGSKPVSDLRKSTSSSGHNKRNSSNAALAAKHDGILAQPQQIQGSECSALTWQQELLGGGKKRSGPHYDVFADARDAETFGGGGGGSAIASNDGQGRRRARAGSVGSGGVNVSTKANSGKAANRGGKTAGGADTPLHIDDLFNSSSDVALSGRDSRRSHPAAVSFVQSDGQPQPSTPAKKLLQLQPQQSGQHPSVAAAIAYAGPNFHNSPSPASLPAPKFSTRMNRIDNGFGSIPPSSLGAGSSSSSSASGSDDDEYEARRKIRSTTAPAEVHAPATPAGDTSPFAATSKEAFFPVLAPIAAPAPAFEAKKVSEPGATVESLLARMMGGVKFSI